MIKLLPASWYSEKTQNRFFDEVDSNLEFSFEYFLQFIFAAVIATLGLIKDSNEVVIGAMLICPLFWPIIGIVTGLITTRKHVLEKSLNILVQSVALAICLSLFIAWIIPNTGITAEIKARVNPTMIDLLIALASSIIGVFLIYSPKAPTAVAGVAVSLSLLPPLCVAGIGVLLGIWQVFWGGFLLFLANFAAIVFFGMFTLYLLGFRPHHGVEKERWRMGLLVSSIFLILISIPLSIFFVKSIRQERIKDSVNYILDKTIKTIDPDAEIDKLNIEFDDTGILTINSNIYLPVSKYITVAKEKELNSQLEAKLEFPVNLNLSFVNVSSSINEQVNPKNKLRQDIETEFGSILTSINPNFGIYNITIDIPEDLLDSSISLEVMLIKDYKYQFPPNFVQLLESKLEQVINYKFEITIGYFESQQLDRKQEKDMRTKISEIIVGDLRNFPGSPVIHSLDYSFPDVDDKRYMDVIVTLMVAADAQTSSIDLERLEKLLSYELGKDVELKIRYVEYTQLK